MVEGDGLVAERGGEGEDCEELIGGVGGTPRDVEVVDHDSDVLDSSICVGCCKVSDVRVLRSLNSYMV